MQHHIDDFSVADVRYTLSEIWRVIAQRRWFFLLPFAGVSLIALVASHWLPRRYTTTTVIKREHDPVLASMMGRGWTEPYAEIRTRMAADLINAELVGEVLDELALPRGLERYENGDLTPAGTAARDRLVDEIVRGLSLHNIESSPNRDVVAINLATPDPTVGPAILNRLRDRYIDIARNRVVDVLQSVRNFFQSEAERVRSKLTGLQKELVAMEVKYPGIDPASTDPTQAEQTALIVERLDLERQREAHEDQRAQVERLLAEQCGDAAGAGAGLPQVENPRVAELQAEIDKLESQIADNKLLKRMTDQHPANVALRRRIEVHQAAMNALPPLVPALAGTDADGGPLSAERLRFRQAEAQAKIAAVDVRLEEIARRIKKIEGLRVATADHREAYLKLRQRAERLREEMNTWQANIGPIGHILAVEDSNRAIHFTRLKDAVVSDKPTSPKAWIVIGACLAIGVGVGGLTVLGAELFDRSYRTVKQLQTSLGIPVIEGIDEILTKAARRQWFVRHFLVLPATTAVLFMALAAAGAAAFLSLERPSSYQAMKMTPIRWLARVF